MLASCLPPARTRAGLPTALPSTPRPAVPPPALLLAADSHFFWGSVLLGYLVYDTAYSLAFFSLRSGAVMLAHHLIGIAGCAIGALGLGVGNACMPALG